MALARLVRRALGQVNRSTEVAQTRAEAAAVDGHVLPLDRVGAVVTLTRPSPVDWIETLPSGCVASVFANSRVALITGLDEADVKSGSAQVARAEANVLLDLMNARSAASLKLTALDYPYLSWWPTPSGPVGQLAFEVHMTFKMQVGGPVQPYPLGWHDSMRFFRASQTTDDLFDAFRNLYLALESILDLIAPVRLRPNGRPAEGEGEWTKRALREAEQALVKHNSAMTFARYTAAPSPDPAQDVFDDLYVASRTAIFHAKNGRPFLLPHEQRDRQQVATALDRYARLYTDLAEAVLGARFLRSGVSEHVFGPMSDSVLNSCEIGLTPDAFASVDDFTSDAAGRFVGFLASRAPEFESSFRACAISRGRFPTSGDIPFRSVGARTKDGQPLTVDGLRFGLTLEGFDTVECLMTFALFNAGHRRRYDT